MKIIQKTKRKEAITIQMALGENGLIIKASKAKKESQQAETKEKLKTTVIRYY